MSKNQTSEYFKAYYQQNHEKILQRSRDRYALKHPEILAKQKERLSDPEKRAKKNEAQRGAYSRMTSEQRAKYIEKKRLDRSTNPDKQHTAHLKNRYGITKEQYDQLLEAQHGKCALCHAAEADPSGARLHVDHDHKTGKVRGLVCRTCNRHLAALDDQEFMVKALAYRA